MRDTIRFRKAEDRKFVYDCLINSCHNFGIRDGRIEQVFSSLAMGYQSEMRMYHDFGHIVSCFQELDNFLENDPSYETILDINSIEMAILYHDVFIDVLMKGGNNEEISALICNEHLRFLGMNVESIAKVKFLILGTFNRSIEAHQEYRLMCDIDYSILGQELEIFEEYERGIKYEYCEWGRYSEFEYKEGRKKFLKGVLALPRIYFTNYFFDKYESKARENIKGLLEKLM